MSLVIPFQYQVRLINSVVLSPTKMPRHRSIVVKFNDSGSKFQILRNLNSSVRSLYHVLVYCVSLISLISIRDFSRDMF